jgi:outer membrane immunogenic protein
LLAQSGHSRAKISSSLWRTGHSHSDESAVFITAANSLGLPMKKAVIAIAAVSTLFGAPALAADMAVKAPPAPPALAPVYDWTGFYVGGNVGAVWQQDDGTSNFVQPADPLAFLDFNPQSNSLTDSSVIGGPQIGYNWQFTNWVVGLEGDWSWLDAKNSFCRQTDVNSAACSDNGRGFLTLTSQTDWIATVRGRLGFTWDRYLVYGTGGAAWGKVDTSINANCLLGGLAGCGVSATPQNVTGNFSTTKSGWTAGGGIEAMLTPNWTVRVEYLRVDLGTVSNTFVLPPSGSGQTASWSRSVAYDIVRFGLNYKFSGR